jgi:Spy/CpxP family protein refolding chaperone
MTNQILRVVLVLSLAMNLGVLGTAAYQRYGGRAAHVTTPGAGVSLREELKLTDEQARTFTELHAALQARVQPMREQMHRRRQAFLEMLATPSPDAEAMDRRLAEMNQGQLEVQRAVADYLLAEMHLLTPEQRAAFVQSLARRSGMQEQPGHLPLLGPGGARRPDEPR